MYYPTPKTLRLTWQKSDRNLASASGTLGNINISDIQDAVIRDTGRFTERYAGDVLYDLRTLDRLVSKHRVEPDEDSIVPFAIRRDGVDGTAFLMSRLQNECLDRISGFVNPLRCYRRILAARVITAPDGYVSVFLRDLTDSFLRMDPDEQANGWDMEKDMLARADMLEKRDDPGLAEFVAAYRRFEIPDWDA